MSNITLLSFDFGLRYIGVAVGQTATQTARSLVTLHAKNGVPDWQQIAALIKEWQPHHLVIGLPLNMDDTEQPITHRAKKFAQQLKNHFKLDVQFVDERLSSVEARATLFAEGGYRALDRHSVNSKAAELILTHYLSTLTN